jgi:hypothetical protein
MNVEFGSSLDLPVSQAGLGIGLSVWVAWVRA